VSLDRSRRFLFGVKTNFYRASSKSTKLIHGGVRYLAEAFEFSFKGLTERREKLALVKEALKERSYFVDNAYYLNKFIPITIPCENIFEMTYYFSGVY